MTQSLATHQRLKNTITVTVRSNVCASFLYKFMVCPQSRFNGLGLSPILQYCEERDNEPRGVGNLIMCVTISCRVQPISPIGRDCSGSGTCSWRETQKFDIACRSSNLAVGSFQGTELLLNAYNLRDIFNAQVLSE